MTLGGSFFQQHRPEVVNLARNEAAQETSERALARIMKVSESEAGVQITTTEGQLGRRIGDAVHHAYGGDLDYRYEKGDKFLRVSWIRDI